MRHILIGKFNKIIKNRQPKVQNTEKIDIKNYKISIIVAIYNNGDYLKNRCFKSIEKLSIFKDIEIILVDDGSSDKITISIIKEIEAKFSNVKTYFFKGPPSGSASRPRNKGIEIATSDYITYLDPDNEAIGDGYTKLYLNIINTNYDIIIGNILFSNKKEMINDYYHSFLRGNSGSDMSDNGRIILKNTKYMVQSIQATLIRRNFIYENNIDMVVGGAGEDTLFFYELLINSKNIKVIDELIHIYYTKTLGSVTNTIDKRFFEKYLILEKEKRKRMEKYNVLNAYLELRYEEYFNGWYLRKFRNVEKDEKEYVRNIIYDIYRNYEDIWRIKSKKIRTFLEEVGPIKINFKLSVIIPVYNNGYYLEKRCINSLGKNSIFNDMEVIIVDDGSSDENTIEIIKNIEKKYSNIKTYFFKNEKSGSASRPRNYGLKLSSTKYITYLDPDNEAIDDGYTALYNTILDSEYDMVIGNIKFKNTNIDKVNDYYGVFIKENNNSNECKKCREMLIKTNFKAQSIQGIIIKKELIEDNKLMMIEGAIGQDTVFFYELMLSCKKIKVIDELIHIYYTGVENSVTNTINSNYFKRHLILEKEKRYILEKYEVLDEYMNTKYETNFKAYIFDKLKLVDNEELDECYNIILNIYEIYKDKWVIRNSKLKRHFNFTGNKDIKIDL